MGDRGRRGSCASDQSGARGVFAAVLSAATGMAIGMAAGVETTAADETTSPSDESVAAEILSVPGHATTRDPGAGKGEPGLDDLLKLPSDYMTKSTPARPVAGASEDEWKQRFTRAEKAIGDARETLAETRRELDGLAETGGASQWSVAPPGASGSGAQPAGTSPLSFKLRQELARNREALDTAEKALRELRIEADLAGVPAEWRVVASTPVPPTAEN